MGNLKAGNPRGAAKRTYAADKLIEQTANAIIAGKPKLLRAAPEPVTLEDRKLLLKISGLSIEQYNEHLGARLRTVADKLLTRIEEAADSNSFKPSELGFVFSVMEDKRARLDGTSRLASASVNVQVNNYGSVSREDLIAQLSGKKPIPVSPAPQANQPSQRSDFPNKEEQDQQEQAIDSLGEPIPADTVELVDAVDSGQPSQRQAALQAIRQASQASKQAEQTGASSTVQVSTQAVRADPSGIDSRYIEPLDSSLPPAEQALD